MKDSVSEWTMAHPKMVSPCIVPALFEKINIVTNILKQFVMSIECVVWKQKDLQHFLGPSAETVEFHEPNVYVWLLSLLDSD